MSGTKVDRVSLVQMRSGQKGKIVEINGGTAWLANLKPWESEQAKRSQR